MLFCPVFANQNSRRSTSRVPAAQLPLRFCLRDENLATATPFSCPFFSCTSALFHFPYPATPLFATLTKTAGVYTNNSHSEARPSPLSIAFKSFLFTFFRTLLYSSKTQPFCFQAVPHSFTKTPGGGGTPFRLISGKPAMPRTPFSVVKPPNASIAPLPGKASPRLYSLLRRSPFAGSRQKYPADPQRPVSHRESLRRQPRLSRPDAGLSRRRAQNPRPPRRHQQLCPFDRFLSDWHAHPALFWDLHPRRASRRRPHRHLQRMGHV